MKKLIVLLCSMLLLVACASEPAGSLTEIMMEDYQAKVDQQESFVVVFSQTTCSFCKAHKENLKEFMQEHPLDVVYVEIDKPENEEAFETLVETDLKRLEYLPATVYVKDGVVEDFCEGELLPEQIEIWLYRNGIELD